jgi:predicted GIY-YIG superfamily endonuclease
MPIIEDTPLTPPVNPPVAVTVVPPEHRGVTVDTISPITPLKDLSENSGLDREHPIGIYVANNSQTGDYYIGATTERKRRLPEHLSKLNTGSHSNQKFQESFNRNSDFEWLEIPIVTREDAFSLERDLIKACRGDPHCLNLKDAVPVSEETREKHRQYQLGKKMPDGFSEKLSGVLLERWKDPEFVQKQREARVGRTLSEEHKANIRASSSFTKSSVPVNIDGVIYPSVRDASTALNVPYTTAAKRLNSPNFPSWERLSP